MISLALLSLHFVLLDLSSWSALTLDLGGGQSAGNWTLSAGNTTVTQTINADPSFYLNNLNQTSYTIDGTWKVNSGAGDDVNFTLTVEVPDQRVLTIALLTEGSMSAIDANPVATTSGGAGTGVTLDVIYSSVTDEYVSKLSNKNFTVFF